MPISYAMAASQTSLYSPCAQLKGEISLGDVTRLGPLSDPELTHAFEIETPERTYYMKAEAAEDRTAWLGCIG